MNGIFKFIGSFCVSSVVIGGMYFLLPNGKLSKPVKYTVSICFICLLLSAFTIGAKPDFTLDGGNYSVDSTDVYKKTAVLTFKTALNNAQIKFSDLSVITSKNNSGGIDIIEVTIISPEDPQRIKEIIGGDYEVNVYEK